MKTMASFGLLATLTSVPALAPAADWFVTLEAGQSFADVRTADVTSLAEVDDEAGSFAVGIGFEPHPTIAVRLSYHDFGSHNGIGFGCPPDVLCIANETSITSFIPIRLEASGFSLVAEPHVDVGQNVSLFATLGVIRRDLDLDNNLPDDRSTEFLYGLGGRLHLSERYAVDLAWEGLNADLSTISLGLRARF